MMYNSNNMAEILKGCRARMTIREDRFISQKEIADRLGISKASMSKYENGLRFISIDTLSTLCWIYLEDAPRIIKAAGFPWMKDVLLREMQNAQKET